MNWFRKDAETGKFLWPGYGENSRVLAWIIARLDGEADGVETPIGVVPTRDALPLDGMSISDSALDQLLSVDTEIWKTEADLIDPHFATFGDHLPSELWDELAALKSRLA